MRGVCPWPGGASGRRWGCDQHTSPPCPGRALRVYPCDAQGSPRIRGRQRSSCHFHKGRLRDKVTSFKAIEGLASETRGKARLGHFLLRENQNSDKRWILRANHQGLGREGPCPESHSEWEAEGARGNDWCLYGFFLASSQVPCLVTWHTTCSSADVLGVPRSSVSGLLLCHSL